MTKAPFGRGQTPKLPLQWCLGGVSKSRPRAYQARALPLSYPGICAAVYIYEKLSAKTSPNLLSAAPLCDTWVFWPLMRMNQREHRALTFSSPPLGFHSVRIRCTTYEAIHLVARLVLRHDTYSYLAYQPNQAPSVFVRLAKRTFDSTRFDDVVPPGADSRT